MRAKYREAEREITAAKDAMVRHMGETDPNLAMVYRALSVISQKLGKKDEAEKYDKLFEKTAPKEAEGK